MATSASLSGVTLSGVTLSGCMMSVRDQITLLYGGLVFTNKTLAEYTLLLIACIMESIPSEFPETSGIQKLPDDYKSDPMLATRQNMFQDNGHMISVHCTMCDGGLYVVLCDFNSHNALLEMSTLPDEEDDDDDDDDDNDEFEKCDKRLEIVKKNTTSCKLLLTFPSSME